MEKLLQEKLIDFDDVFKNLNWNEQLQIISCIESHENNNLNEENNLLISLEKLLFELNEFYLKSDMEAVQFIITENIKESIIRQGLIFKLKTRWRLREDSQKVLILDSKEVEAILEEIINSMLIKRIHRVPNLVRKTISEKFKKEYDKDTFVVIVKFFDFLINSFCEKNQTFYSLKLMLEKETLLPTEIMATFINTVGKYKKEIEKAFLIKTLSEGFYER